MSLPTTGEASLQRDGDKLIVQARVEETTPAVLALLREAGAEIRFVSDEYGTVDMAVAEQRLRDVAAVGGVESVVELLEPMINSAPAIRAGGPRFRVAPPCGAVISEGDLQMRVAEARPAFDVDGTGVKVGVISDSFDIAQGAADARRPGRRQRRPARGWAIPVAGRRRSRCSPRARPGEQHRRGPGDDSDRSRHGAGRGDRVR